MIVRAWELDDVNKIVLQPSQEYLAQWLGNLTYEAVEEAGAAWSAEDEEGEVLVIAGISYHWEDRALLWSFISEKAGSHFLSIHREVLARINEFQENCRRLEMTVDVDFPEAHRWAKMLGFLPEGYLKAYLPDGRDVIMYSRVR